MRGLMIVGRLRVYCFLVVGLAVIAVTIVLFFKPEPAPVIEPEYGGRTVSEWLHQLSHGAPEQATGAFRELGKEAVPILLGKLRRNHASPPHRLYGALWMRLPNSIARRLPRPHMPDVHLSERTAVAFSHIGRAAIPQMLQALDRGNVDTRIAVLNGIRFLAVLGEMESFRNEAVPRLTELTSEKHPNSVRSAAAEALKEVNAVR